MSAPQPQKHTDYECLVWFDGSIHVSVWCGLMGAYLTLFCVVPHLHLWNTHSESSSAGI